MLKICRIFKHTLTFRSLSFFPNGEYYIITTCNNCNENNMNIIQSEKKINEILKKTFNINDNISDILIKNKTYSENWGIEYTYDFIKSFIEIGIPMGYWNMFYYRREYRNIKK